MPGFGVGYVQKGDELVEIESVTATEDDGPDGLPQTARIEMGPDLPTLAVEPLAFGPMVLTAPDGRVTHFVRALCRVRDESDGREGLGWVEWNRIQS